MKLNDLLHLSYSYLIGFISLIDEEIINLKNQGFTRINDLQT